MGLGRDGRATRVINKAVTNWLAVVDAWCFYSAARLLGIRGASPWCPFQATACKYYLKSSLYTGLTSLEMSICLTTYNLVQKQWQIQYYSPSISQNLSLTMAQGMATKDEDTRFCCCDSRRGTIICNVINAQYVVILMGLWALAYHMHNLEQRYV